MQTDLSGVPHLDQYFGEWAMQEDRFLAHHRHLQEMNVHLHLQSDYVKSLQAQGDADVLSQSSVAILELHGTLMKHRASFTKSTSTVRARRQLRELAADPRIAAIMLHIDSPGGTVAGTEDLANDIAAAARQKPVLAFIEDLGASAAFWLASQASSISANGSALVGSIGTFGVVHDLSNKAAMEGVVVHVIKAGDFKGAGVPGTQVTQEQLVDAQRIVNGLNERFLAAVSAGRRMPLDKVQSLADGRVHIAAEAKALGLIDAVETFDEAFSRLVRDTQKRNQRTMSEHVSPQAVDAVVSTPDASTSNDSPSATIQVTELRTAAQPATYHELKEALAGADDAFLCTMLQGSLTLEKAQQAWMVEQNKRIEAADERAKQAATQAPGVDPVATGSAPATATGEAAKDTFNALVAEKKQAGMSNDKAVRSVVRENPDLHKAMLEEANTEYRRRQS